MGGRSRAAMHVARLCYDGCITMHRSLAMTTTTIRLPPELKARVARAAARAGTTAHGFILEAIAEKAGQAELQAEFLGTAEERYAGIVATGKTVPWKDMRRYLERRVKGDKPTRPKPRALAR